MKYVKLALLGCLVLTTASCSHFSKPGVPDIADYPNLGAYISAINTSTDPQTEALRKQIMDGPAALAREKAECLKRGISLTPIVPTIPPNENAYSLYQQSPTAIGSIKNCSLEL